MWNVVEGNKIMNTHSKIEFYKMHMKNLKNVKSQLSLGEPFKPTFSLSKRQNKYHKNKETEIQKQNIALLGRMIQLESEPIKKTCMYIPLTVPSNKITYAAQKNRERKSINKQLNKENLKILNKISWAESTYGKQVWKQDWKKNMKYKNNILKKEFIPDYRVLVREEQNITKSRARPKTAMPSNY